MARVVWKGSISFGLLQVPVHVHTATSRSTVSLKSFDQRDMNPIGYQRVNKATGEEVPKEEIVKGYEHEKGQFVVLSEEEINLAAPEATQTIDIVGFLDASEVDLLYFDKPYYLGTTRHGMKPYALLREALRETSRIGLARVVIRTRQYLAALVVREEMLVLELLRYPDEIRSAEDIEVPSKNLEELRVSDQEVQMARQLIDQMTLPFEPENYRDEFQERLLELIDEKVEKGRIESVSEPPRREAEPEVVDLMAILKRSIEESEATQKTAGDANDDREESDRSGDQP